MIRSLLTGTKPVLIHCAGKKQFNPVWDSLNKAVQRVKAIEIIPDLSVITWNSPSNKHYNTYKSLGLFEECCQRLGVPCMVLTSSGLWANRLKIPLTLEYLKTCKTKYIIGADSSDVLAFGLPEPTLLKCGMLLNAESRFWPESLPDIRAAEEILVQGHFRYLNSGLWLAERAYALHVFSELNHMVGQNLGCPVYCKSDQYLFKLLYLKESEMQIDSACNLFLNTAHLDPSHLQVGDF